MTLTTAGTLNLTAPTATGFEQLVLANGTNNITLNQAIAAAATAGSYNVITGGTGYDSIVTTVGAAQKINLTTVTGIEAFTFAGSGAPGSTHTFSGAAATGLVLTSTTLGETITLGDFTNSVTLAGANTKTITGGTGIDTVTLAANQANNFVTINEIETVVGSTGANTVVLAAGSITTVSMSGVETVNAGTGAQTVNFTGATGVTYKNALVASGADVVNFNSTNGVTDTISFADANGNGTAGNGTVTALTITAPAPAAAGSIAAASSATVNGFNIAHDVITLDLSNNTGGALTGNAAMQSVAAAGAVTLSNTANITVFNFEMGGTTSVLAGVTNGAALISNIGTLSATAAGDKGYMMAYDNGKAYLYAYLDNGNGTVAGAADGTIQAGEVALIGTFNDVSSFNGTTLTGVMGSTNFNIAV